MLSKAKPNRRGVQGRSPSSPAYPYRTLSMMLQTPLLFVRLRDRKVAGMIHRLFCRVSGGGIFGGRGSGVMRVIARN